MTTENTEDAIIQKYVNLNKLVNKKFDEMQVQDKIQFLNDYDKYNLDGFSQAYWSGAPLDSILRKTYDEFPGYYSFFQVCSAIRAKIQQEFCQEYISILQNLTKEQPSVQLHEEGSLLIGREVKIINIRVDGTPIFINGKWVDKWVSGMNAFFDKVALVEKYNSDGLYVLEYNGDSYNFPRESFVLI